MTATTEEASTDDAKGECDVVMKGGITSGVVYPLALAEIAVSYRLRQIGGTSAGAIAAGGAAAAEVGRDTDGFELLTQLPDKLAGDAPGGAKGSLMQNLFQPQKVTEATYAVAGGWMFSSAGLLGKVAALLGNIARYHPIALLLGLLPGLLVVVASIFWTDGAMRVISIVAGLALAALVGAVVVSVAIARKALSGLDQNNFGLCNGSTTAGARTPGLTEFLADEFDRLAGRDPTKDAPLTFGDLQDHGVSLKMLATNVTQSVPILLPDDLRSYYYDPGELSEMFPQRIVDHMERHARVPEDDKEAEEWEARLPKVRMPEVDDLPVVVAVRMSLSFPVLLSALPLWAVDYNLEDQPMGTNWISDGGITSNFPSHFFDSPLPTRPTFAINLGSKEDLSDDEAENVFFPTRAGSGILNRWTRFDGVVGFLRSVLDTMQNWADNEQTHIPGYRDRIATVWHTKDEGGMNLNMPQETITRLAKRGREAGKKFTGEFDFVEHRWIRYRSVMQLIEEYLDEYQDGWGTEPVGAEVPSFREMIENKPDASYTSDWSGVRAAYASSRTEELVKLAGNWPDPEGKQSFAKGAPNPKPTLRVTPDIPTRSED